jgi:peptidoglycan-associated lipoprotein
MKMQFGGVLLLGVMAASSLVAQNAPAEKKTAVAPSNYLEIAITYDALHASASSGNNFWLQGGGLQADGHFSHGLGVVADLAGEHTGNMHDSGVGLDMVTMTFGPRYTWQPARYRHTVLYGQALVGQANGFNSVFPSASGPTSSANGLALKVGGGVNYTLSRRFAVRLIEADWLRTQLPNGTTSVQNNLHLGAGLILRFY